MIIQITFSHAVEIKSEKMSFHANTILTGTHFLRMVTCDQVSFFVYLFLGWAIVSAIVFCGNIYIFLRLAHKTVQCLLGINVRGFVKF